MSSGWLWVIHPTAPDANYRIEVVGEVDPENFNADVQVIRYLKPASARPSARSRTSTGCSRRRGKGECDGDMWIRSPDMVIVRRFDRETIEATVAALIAEGDISSD